MNKVFSDSEEKFVKTVMLYGDKDDGKVFLESDHINAVDKDTLKNLYLKDVTIEYNDELFKPVSFKDNGTDAIVTVVNATGNYSFYSAEHTDSEE